MEIELRRCGSRGRMGSINPETRFEFSFSLCWVKNPSGGSVLYLCVNKLEGVLENWDYVKMKFIQSNEKSSN